MYAVASSIVQSTEQSILQLRIFLIIRLIYIQAKADTHQSL